MYRIMIQVHGEGIASYGAANTVPTRTLPDGGIDRLQADFEKLLSDPATTVRVEATLNLKAFHCLSVADFDRLRGVGVLGGLAESEDSIVHPNLEI